MIQLKKIIITIIVHIAFTSLIQAQTTICWDTSLSMQERDITKDFSVLERVFEKNKDQEVQLLLFNIEVVEKSYRITDGDWQILKEDLLNVVYDGGTIFSELTNRIKYPNVYVFTDGKNNLTEDVLSLKSKNFIINSSANRNIDFLNRTVLLTKSRLMDFASLLPENIKRKNKKIAKEELIKGKIYIDNEPASNISVGAFGGDTYLTDVNGNFTIKAQVGDSILVSSIANNTYKVLKITSKEATKIFLDANIYSLDEVTVVEKRKRREFVTTSLGKQNKNQLGYAVQSIYDEDITEINTNVSSALQGKFSGVSYGQNQDLSQAILRGGGNSLLANNYALIVVNGVPLRQSNSASGQVVDTSFLNPSNIGEVTVLKSLAATNRFGSLGANGAILITTKAALANNKNGDNQDSARLKNNVFDGRLNIKGSGTDPSYITELKTGTDLNSTYDMYLKQRSKYKQERDYFFNVYNFINPMNVKVATQIASNILEQEDMVYEQLRALFIKAIKNRNKKLQYVTAIKMLEDYPEKTQSYYDRALVHINQKEYQDALDIFLAIMDGSASYGLKFNGLHKRVKTELEDLIYHHKSSLDISKVSNEYLKNGKYSARLVFDWDNSGAEFDIQFVNPQNRFFEWKHTNFENKKRIEDELKNGFSSEQFDIFGDESKGKWIINVSYLSNGNNQDAVVPIFIKCRIDYDYGTPNSRSQDYILRLTEPTDKQFFFEFTL